MQHLAELMHHQIEMLVVRMRDAPTVYRLPEEALPNAEMTRRHGIERFDRIVMRAIKGASFRKKRKRFSSRARLSHRSREQSGQDQRENLKQVLEPHRDPRLLI